MPKQMARIGGAPDTSTSASSAASCKTSPAVSSGRGVSCSDMETCDSQAEKALSQRLLERWNGKAASVTEMAISPESVHQLEKATGVWLCDTDASRLRRVLPGTTVARACQALLQRGGVLGASGDCVRLMGSASPTDQDARAAGQSTP